MQIKQYPSDIHASHINLPHIRGPSVSQHIDTHTRAKTFVKTTRQDRFQAAQSVLVLDSQH
eukprot:958910-Prymnesium_polylepis.2